MEVVSGIFFRLTALCRPIQFNVLYASTRKPHLKFLGMTSYLTYVIEYPSTLHALKSLLCGLTVCELHKAIVYASLNLFVFTTTNFLPLDELQHTCGPWRLICLSLSNMYHSRSKLEATYVYDLDIEYRTNRSEKVMKHCVCNSVNEK